MGDVYFIDREGNRIHMKEISSHIGLAHAILRKNEKLKEEFEKSGRTDPTDFLICDKGYIKITEQLYIRRGVYYSPQLSKIQRKILRGLVQDGYGLDDLKIRQLQDNVR